MQTNRVVITTIVTIISPMLKSLKISSLLIYFSFSYDLPVEGRCGGMAMCATCQCYLESDTELDEQSDGELDMLDEAFFVEDNSRLGCQIPITDAIDGIVLRLAPEGN